MSGRAALNVLFNYQVRVGIDAKRVAVVEEWLDPTVAATNRRSARRAAVLAAGGEVH